MHYICRQQPKAKSVRNDISSYENVLPPTIDDPECIPDTTPAPSSTRKHAYNKHKQQYNYIYIYIYILKTSLTPCLCSMRDLSVNDVLTNVFMVSVGDCIVSKHF